MRPETDSIDLREIGAALRGGIRWIAVGGFVGLLLAGLVILMVAPRYESTATVLLRSNTGTGAGGLFSSGSSDDEGISLGGLADVLSLDSGIETEMEILASRAVIGAVVDSLGLQARVTEPWGWSTTAVFASARFPREMEEAEYEFRRSGEGYRVTGPGVSGQAVPGEPFLMNGAVVTLRSDGLPEEFTIETTDFQDALRRTSEALRVEKAAGSVAELSYRTRDAVTAAAVPNGVIAQYLARRTTTDRGVNQRRYEFLSAHTDSLAMQLAAAGETLRRHQEESGVLVPEVRSEAEVEQALRLRSRLQELEVEANALERVMDRGTRGRLDAREIASYPTLIQNPAINHLLARLADLDARRVELLERRTEADPDVRLLDRSIRQVEDRIVSIARSFHGGIERQVAEVRGELEDSRAILAALPVQVEKSYRLEREVERLSETLVALQTQVVQARLAAIAEGGGVRQIDTAEPPNERAFPKPPVTLALGLMGGVFFGMVGVVGSAAFGRRVNSSYQVERIAGVRTILFDPRTPLLVGGGPDSGSVLVLAVDEDGSSAVVAHRIAATAALRGQAVALADLTTHEEALLSAGAEATAVAATAVSAGTAVAPLEPTEERREGYPVFRGDIAAGSGLREALEALEHRFALVVVALPSIVHPATTVALAPDRPVVLVARAGRTNRRDLESTVGLLTGMGITLAGAVLLNGNHDA